MNKARRITRGRGIRPCRRYSGRLRTSAFRGNTTAGADRADGGSDYALAEDTISASHLKHRSVRSEAIEDYSVYSIHLSPESITSSKIALSSVELEHLNFNPVQGAAERPVMQQFGQLPFCFPEGATEMNVPVALQAFYPDGNYVMVVSCNDPAFQAGVRAKNELQAVVGITRSEDSPAAEGWLSWIAIGSK